MCLDQSLVGWIGRHVTHELFQRHTSLNRHADITETKVISLKCWSCSNLSCINIVISILFKKCISVVDILDISTKSIPLNFKILSTIKRAIFYLSRTNMTKINLFSTTSIHEVQCVSMRPSIGLLLCHIHKKLWWCVIHSPSWLVKWQRNVFVHVVHMMAFSIPPGSQCFVMILKIQLTLI